MKFRLIEQAEKINDIRSDLRSYRSKYIEHLICIYLWKHSDYVHHWISEIYSYYNSVSKVKGKNKFPSYDEINNSIYGGIEDVLLNNLPHLVEYIQIEKESELPKIALTINDYIELKSFIEKVSYYISAELSIYGIIKFTNLETFIKNYL